MGSSDIQCPHREGSVGRSKRRFSKTFLVLFVAIIALVAVPASAAADSYSGGSGNMNAFFDYCDDNGCAPMGYTWHGSVDELDYSFYIGPDGYYIDNISYENQLVEVTASPYGNPCDIEGAISTEVFEFHSTSNYDSTIYVATQGQYYVSPPDAVIYGGYTYPNLNATEAMVQPNASVWSPDCTNLWYSVTSASWQYSLP